MDDDQVKNAMSEIRSQLRSASPAELARLSMAVGGLLNSAISPEMENQVKELQAVVDRRAEEAEAAQSSKIYTENAERGGNDKDDPLLALIAKMMERNDEIYEAFSVNHEEHLARKQEDAKNLKDAMEATKSGEPISEELQKKLKKSDKQKKEEREHNKKVAETIKAAKAEKEYHDEEIRKIDSEIAGSSHDPQKVQELQKKKSDHEKRKEKVSVVTQQGNKEIDVCLEQAEFIHNGKKAAKEKGVNQELWAEKEKDYNDIVVASLGKKALLERAKEKNDGTEQVLLNLMKDQEVSQAMFSDGMEKTAKQDPKKAEKLIEALNSNSKDNNLSNGSLHPPNTPNVKTPTSDKGHSK